MDLSRSTQLIFTTNLAANQVLINAVLGADFIAGIDALHCTWQIVPLSQILELRFGVHPGYRDKTLRRPHETFVEHVAKLRGQELRFQFSDGNVKVGRLLEIEASLLWIQTFDELVAVPASSIAVIWLWKTDLESRSFMTAFLEIEGLENDEEHYSFG